MAKSADYTEIDTEALNLIKSRPNGILQNEFWKTLGISSRDGSRIAKRLEDAGLVVRNADKNGSTKTYRITAVVKEDSPKEFDMSLLMAGETIVPCVACNEECNVSECPMLEEWIYELAFSEIE